MPASEPRLVPTIRIDSAILSYGEAMRAAMLDFAAACGIAAEIIVASPLTSSEIAAFAAYGVKPQEEADHAD